MSLYEIVLTFDDREEIRVTDRRPSLGDVLKMGGRTWRVAAEHAPAPDTAADVRPAARFVCELAGGELSRAEAA